MDGVQSAGGRKNNPFIRITRQLEKDPDIWVMFLKSFRNTVIWQLQLASNKELDLFIHASGGRKIMEDISKPPSMLGIDEILNDILKNNFSGTDTQVGITGHAERRMS